MKKSFLLTALFLCSFVFAMKIEKSESKFFPKDLGNKILLFKSFETFWWGFVVVEPAAPGINGYSAHEVCVELKVSGLFQRVECEQTPADYSLLLTQWARDLPLREDPSQNLRKKFLSALGKASLPMPAELFNALRQDPLESYESLIAVFKERLALPFDRVEGVFTDSETGRAIIPVQPKFGPNESEKLEPLRKRLATNTHFLGPHASTLENKEQISIDLRWVSWLGGAVTLFYILLFLYLRQLKLSVLLLPAFIGAALSACTIDWIFGSIHGLTLCFGTGIIGLTVDFGLHAAFHSHSLQVWKSILSAFVTTLLCLVVIAFSEIPLLRELMYFSILGFIYSFLLYYVFRKQISKYLGGRERNIPLKGNRVASLTSCILALGLVIGFVWVKPAFDFKQFDYQTAKTKKLSQWLYPKTIKTPPLFQVASGEFESALRESQEEIRWGKEHGISLESPGRYLPVFEERKKHLLNWEKLQCGKKNLNILLTSEEKKLFSPLLLEWECKKIQGLNQIVVVPEYIRALSHENQYLTLWLPQDKAQQLQVREKYPEAQSLGDLTTTFSQVLSTEVLWMLPLSLVLIVAYLLFYYKNLFLAFCGIIPFLLGCGAICWAAILFSLPLSFMTLMALIMLLGSSVDYGIFAVDALSFSKSPQEIHKTTTAMLLSSITTLLGFFPLLWCKHQVLFQLGAALTLGVVGTLIGTYFTVPAILAWKKAR